MKIETTYTTLSSSGKDFIEVHLFTQLITGINISSLASFHIFVEISSFELFQQSLSFIIFKMILVDTGPKTLIFLFNDFDNLIADKKVYFIRSWKINIYQTLVIVNSNYT